MTRLPLGKSVLTAACAAVLAVCPAVVSDASAASTTHPAAAAATHPTAHATGDKGKGDKSKGHKGDKHGGKGGGKHGKTPKPGKKPHKKPVKVDKLAGARTGATHAIKAQLRSVTHLVTLAGAFEGPDAAALGTVLAADRDAVNADLAAVANAATRTELAGLRAAAVQTRHVAGSQYQLVTAIDAITTDATDAATTLASLQQELDAMAADQEDVSAQQSELDDATTALAAIDSELGDGLSAVLGLSPTANKGALRTAAHTAHVGLDDAADQLAQAQADLLSVEQSLGMAP